MSKKNTKNNKNIRRILKKNTIAARKASKAASVSVSKQTAANQSWWQKAKNTLKNTYNTVVNTGKKVLNKAGNTKIGKAAKWAANTKVGKAVGAVVKGTVKVATAPVRYGYKGAKWAVNKGIQGAKVAGNAIVQGGKWVANSKVGKAVVKGAQWVANSKVGKAAAKYGPQALKWSAKTAKWCSKRIPGVCLAVGVVEAGYYTYKGEYAKAGVALASGAVSCFPPYGTAAGIAMEAGVVAYDVYENNQKEKAQEQAKAEAARKVAEAKKAQEAQRQKEAEQKKQQKLQLEREAEEAKKRAEEAKAQEEQRLQQQLQQQNGSMVNDGQGGSANGENTANSGQDGSVNSENTVSGGQGGSTNGENTASSGQGDSVNSENTASGGQGGSTNGNAPEININKLQDLFKKRQQEQQQQTSSRPLVQISSMGNAIICATEDGNRYEITQSTLEQQMSSKRAKGTMEKLQAVVNMEKQPAGLGKMLGAYIPEFRSETKGTAKVNRNLIDSTVKAIGGSSKATSITIDGKKIKAKDIQESYGCTKKEAKQILKAYGRAIEDGANLDGVLRDIAQGKHISHDNQKYFAMLAQAKTR